MNTQLHLLSANHLADRCAEESSKKNLQSRDDRFCYELVKRAFGLEDHDALGFVLNIYKDIWSKFWIRDARVFETHPVTADDFKSIAFLKVYYQIKGSRFASFSSLNAFLSYLHTTLVRTIAEYYRSAEARQFFTHSAGDSDEEVADLLENIASNNDIREKSEKNLMWQEIEQRVYFLLPNEHDRILFDCWAKQHLSRAEIVREFKTIWPDENTVRVALQRIRRRLYKDEILRDLLKGSQ